jgi:hypothetical protein
MNTKSSAEFQMDFLNRLSFNRFGGTDDEKRAAELILSEIEALGGKGELFEFSIPGYSISKASFTVLEPYEEEITVTGIGRSGSTGGPIEAELFYAEQGEEENFKGAEGKIVLINSTHPTVYKRLTASGALGFLTFSGAYQDDREKTDLDQRFLRPRLTDKSGKLPGLCMRTEDAITLLHKGATKVRMELEGQDEEHPSRNVVAFIKGTEYPEKEFLFTAHYDSTIYGLGSWDNASGCANILELYRYYLNHPPRHSMRFIWCGSEEQGLLGSKAYVAANEDKMDNILLCQNFDMTGTEVGRHRLLITANEELKYFVKFLSKEVGFITKIDEDIHSSDSTPFAHKGVPAIGYMRDGQAGGHSRFDIPWPLSAKRLAEATDFAIAVTNRLDGCAELPFKREISAPIAEKLENYLTPKD